MYSRWTDLLLSLVYAVIVALVLFVVVFMTYRTVETHRGPSTGTFVSLWKKMP